MTQPSTSLLEHVRTHAAEALRPLVEAIDREGLYPEAYLRELGALGGFAALAPEAQGGSGLGLATQIQVLSAVGEECGSTAFLGWCQTACAWYLLQTRHAAVRERYLPAILRGERLAGSAMSNTVKHLCGIERHLLQAVPVADGYQVKGSLPWVSNLGPDHVFAATAQLPDGRYVMFMAGGQTPGVSLKSCPEFCALEGTRTLNVRFDDVQISAADILAQPEEFDAYIARIKAGFILLQMGIGAGVVQGCLKIIRESNAASTVTNAYLDDQHDTLQAELDAALAQTLALADAAERHQAPLLDVLKLRLAGAELALRAAQSAALHAGAKGYLVRHAAQRRTREALFVAIVTPATKHLRREIAELQAAPAGANTTRQPVAEVV
ncbi:MAG: acyl-CoA dehydrogenase family protein [Brachymonas sp.]|nr:acyl-CoA dehydrogenase family protein [Brachymonas sp.]